jgi:hypothetical protein
MPRFYVVVVFEEVSSDSFFVGGESVGNFVRIVIAHIARTLPTDLRSAALDIIESKLAPHIRDRGLDWELHIDETPIDLWRVQGLPAPEYGSEAEVDRRQQADTVPGRRGHRTVRRDGRATPLATRPARNALASDPSVQTVHRSPCAGVSPTLVDSPLFMPPDAAKPRRRRCVGRLSTRCRAAVKSRTFTSACPKNLTSIIPSRPTPPT